MKHYVLMSALLLVVLAIGAGCSEPEQPTYLPHRAEWELYRQANSPDSHHCELGTVPYYLVDGTFLECMRGHTNE
jgi:hypothetical protein